MKPIRTRHIVVLALALLLLAVPASAQASASAVIRDCADNGKLDRTHSRADLQRAKKRLPADLDEYSDCREVIANAINNGPNASAAGGGGGGAPTAGGGGAGGGSAPISPAEGAADAQALESATAKAKNPSVQIGDKVVKPGKNGLFGVAGVPNGMPLPLTVALLAIAAVAVGVGAYRMGRRIPLLAGISVPRPSLRRVPLPRVRR